MKKSLLLLLLVLPFLFSACAERRGGSATTEGDSVRMGYASLLRMVETPDYTWVTVRNPWDTTRTLHRYVLVPQGRALPASLPEGTVVRTPLRKAAVYASVHIQLLCEWQALDRIVGVCDVNYLQEQRVLKRCREGRIRDFGSSMNPDMEQLMDTRPDAILLSPYENSGGYGKLQHLGIPIIECADYMETSPLGRAEWMKFYGRLFGLKAQADSQFSNLEQRYTDLRKRVAHVTSRPTVFIDLKVGATWYQAGGNSYMARLLADAGATYLWKDNDESGSVPLSLETVLERAHDADFWLIKYNQRHTDKTYEELKRDNEAYTQFRAFRERNIYQCNTDHVRYYDQTPFHPDLLLKNFLAIFHPELQSLAGEEYYRKLAE